MRYAAGAVAALALAAPLPAQALPKNGDVIQGQARVIQLSPTKLEILQKSPSAEIKWQSFNIARNETVIFIQGGAANKALNEIQGGKTVIDGRLIADGTLILINANGILFGADARAAVARLIASTANISAADFANGRLNLTIPGQPDATIANAGQITARQGGLVAFIAPNVVNSGVINARLGKIALAGGDAATLDLYGDGLISLVLGGASKAATIQQTGKLFAAGGTVRLSASQAKSLVESVVNLSGIVRADTISRQGGTIVLTASQVTISGEAMANGTGAGTRGGTVKLLGDSIHLTRTASLGASGPAGGGTVLVGGNYQGKGPEPRASVVTADRGSRITASATRSGRGGRVVLWSKKKTTALGRIDATGAGGGKGGLIETSSGDQLVVGGAVNPGPGGRWLLDPHDVTVTNSDSGTTVSCGAVSCTVTPTQDGSTVSAATIDNALANSSQVQITTSGGGTDLGDITVAAPIVKSAGGDSLLILHADHSVIVDAGISSTVGKLGVDLIPGTGKIMLDGDIATNGGQFDASGPTTVAQRMNSITVTGTNGAGAMFFTNTVDGAGTGAGLKLTAGAGSITFQQPIGSTTPLGGLDIVSALSADFQSAVALNHFQQESGSQLHFRGNTTIVTTDPATDAADVTASEVVFEPGTAFAASGNVVFTLDSLSSLSLPKGASIQVTNGTFTQKLPGIILLGGTISTAGGDIDIDGTVQVTDNAATVCTLGADCTTSFAGGSVLFNGSIETMGATPRNFRVAANDDATFNGFMGGSSALGNVSIAANSISIAGLTASGTVQLAAAGNGVTGNAISGAIVTGSGITVGPPPAGSAANPPTELTGTIDNQKPTGVSDTAHLPTLAGAAGAGPYTFDGVCFAACGTSNSGGNTGGNSGAGSGGNTGGSTGSNTGGMPTGTGTDLANLTAAEQATPNVINLTTSGASAGPTIAAFTAAAPVLVTLNAPAASGETYRLDSVGGTPSNAATTAEIVDAYQHAFGRAPTAAEQNGWVAAVQAHGWNEGAIISSLNGELIGSSSNARTDLTNVITAAFNNVLGRAPTPQELSKYAGMQSAGTPLDYSNYAGMLLTTVEAGPGSSQYATGAAVRADMVIRSYEQNFGRPPSQDELNYWDGQLLAGKVTYAQMSADNANWYQTHPDERNSDIARAVQTIFGTTEANVGWSTVYPELVRQYGTPQNYQQLYTDLTNMVQPGGQRLAIIDAYLAIYGRNPTAAELAEGMGQKEANGDLANFSDFTATLTAQRTQSILNTYYTALGRAPTPAELASATRLLASGKSTAALYNAVSPISATPEQAAMVIRAYLSAYNRYPTQAELNAAASSSALISYGDSYASMVSYLRGKSDPLKPKNAMTIVTALIAPTPEGNLTLPGGFKLTPQADGTFQIAAAPNASGSLTFSTGGTAITFQNAGGRLSAVNGGNILTEGGGQFINGGFVVNTNGSNLKMDDGQAVSLVGDNVISNDGGSVVSNDGGSVISNDGGRLWVSAAVISNDGGSLIAEGGGMVVSTNGSNFVGNNSSSFVGNNSSSFVGNNGSAFVGNNSSSFVGNNGSALVSTTYSNVVNTNGSNVVNTNGSNVVNTNGSNVVNTNGSNVVNTNGSNVVNTNGSNVVNTNGSNVVNTNGSNVVNTNGSNVVNTNGSNLLGFGGNALVYGATLGN